LSFDRVQRASEGRKYGDTNEAHVLGVWAVYEIFQQANMYPVKGFLTKFDQTFLAWNTNKGLTFDQWLLDLVAFKEPYFTVENQEQDPDYIVEVDGEKHDKRPAQINDGIVKEWCRYRYPKAKFVRVNKYDCAYPDFVKGKLGLK